MILSVSSTRIGIKRSAIDIIIAISCTGTCSRPSGFNARSSPSVSWFGVVVSVMSEVPSTRYVRRIIMRTAAVTPSFVTVIFHTWINASPGVKKRLNIAVITISTIIARKPLIMYLNGTPEIRITSTKNAVTTASPGSPLYANTEIRNTSVPNSFTRGSIRWITDPVG